MEDDGDEEEEEKDMVRMKVLVLVLVLVVSLGSREEYGDGRIWNRVEVEGNGGIIATLLLNLG